MTTLREAAQQALEALETNRYAVANQAPHLDVMEYNAAITSLRAALAQQDEPVWMHPWPPVRAQQAEPQTLDEAMQQPRAMAQAYEAGYNAGVAHEREACAQVCEARFVGDLNREDMEARRCAAAIRARGNT